MNIVLILIALIPSVLFLFYFRQNKELKSSYLKLQEDFARFRESKEAFSIELEKSNSELATKTTDALTGLPARSAFDDRLQQAIAQAARFQNSFAVMSMDIDDFSRVDQGDPGIRDELLVQIAQRLLSSIRQIDSVTRYAGSHFVFLLPQITQPETAAYVASRLQESILQPFIVGDQEYRLTASLGIAVYPLDGESMEILLQKASGALNEARRGGKNKYFFWHREIHALSERESQIFVSLRSAEVFQHLRIHYSPQVAANSNRIIGIYAMAGLLHPKLGEITSPEFIKMAEHCGRATEIMAWLFRKGIEEASLCHEAGEAPVVLALSVTSRQIENAHFVYQMAQIARELDREKVQPTFEITDSPSRVHSHSSLIKQGFATLTEAGVHFAIQMVAIGHNLLQKFPTAQFSYLKIDVRLVNTTLQQPEGESILSSMMTLTKNAGLDVVVEGVDEEGQKQYLIDLGFEKLQGRLFEFRLPGQEITELTI